MFIGWLTCIPAVLLPHFLCRSTTANAPANHQMPIASVVSGKRKKTRIKKNDINKKNNLNNIDASDNFFSWFCIQIYNNK